MNPNKSTQAADIWLFIAVSAYFVMNGAQLWETAIMIPAWTEAPPASLHFFHGPYALDFKIFWIAVHSLHDFAFIVAIVFNWRIPGRRTPMLLLFVVHGGLRAWTLAYFAPEIISFQQTAYAPTVDPALAEKAARWRNLNYLRVGAFVLVNLGLLSLLRSAPPRDSQRHPA